MTHQIYLRDPAGNLQTVINNFVRLEYARGESKTGFMNLSFDPSSIDTTLFRLDTRLEPWRQVGEYVPYLDGETVFFVRNWGHTIDSTGRELFQVQAFDANYLLDGRIIAYPAGDIKADQTDQADDLLKSIVAENMAGDATDTARSIATYLTISPDLAAGPSITKAFAHRNVMQTLQDIVFESYQQGTYLAFDMIYTSAAILDFRTYTGRRGVDHGKTSAQPVIVSRERKNLETPEMWENHENEITYVYAGGQGEKAARVIKTATLATAASASPFNRRELFIDARMTDVDASVQSEANVAVIANRYKRTLTGRIIDTDGCQYGVHYRFGDVVYAEYRGLGFDAHLDYIHVTVEGGRETLDLQIKGEA